MPAGTGGASTRPQVRAMFDRIAGLYDRMNSVMTAGLHHQWRRRAADLADARARAAARSTWPPGRAISRSSWPRASAPGGEVVGVDFSERMLELARPRRPPAASRRASACASRPATRSRSPTPTASSTPPPSASAPATSPTSSVAWREMARVVRPGGRVVVLEITTPQRPPLSTFFELWFDRVVPALGRLRSTPQAYSYLPSSVKRFPGPDELAARMWDAGLREIRYVLTAGGIIALARREWSRPDEHRGAQAVVDAGGEALTRRHGPRRAADGGARRRSRPRARALRRRHDRRRAASGCARCSSCLAAGAPPPETDGLVRAAVAVELVHGATLVHDDVLDGSALRRGRPTVVATGGRGLATATGDLLFSRAFAELAGGGSADAGARPVPGEPRAGRSGSWPSARTRSTPRSTSTRYLERCRLKTAVLFRAACELGALEADGRSGRARGVRRADRAGLPAPRRRPRRVRAARAHRQAAGRRSARRHRHAAADPGPRGAIRSWPRSTCGRCGPPADAAAVCERIAATGALDDARGRARRAGRRRQGRACRRCPTRQRAALELVGRRRRRALRVRGRRGVGRRPSGGWRPDGSG